MQYQTTRNQKQLYSFTEMMRINVPIEGGYFVPETMPLLSDEFLNSLIPLNFLERAKKIFGLFAVDLNENQISDICETAWRQDFENGVLPESKTLNPYLENPLFVFMDNGKTGSYLDFINSFLLSIIQQLSKDDEKWYLLSNEKNANTKSLLALDFDPQKYIPLLLINSRNTNNFTLREMQYVWNENRYQKERVEENLNDSLSSNFENSEDDNLIENAEAFENEDSVLKINKDTDKLSDSNLSNKIIDFTDEFTEQNKLSVFRIKADIREFEKIAEKIFWNTELRKKINAENKFIYHMGSLNFAYYIALIIILISAYLDLIEQEQLNGSDDFTFAFPNNNLDFLYVSILLKEMGLPISTLCLTTNQNNSIVDFLQKGILKENRKFFKTNTEGLDQIYFTNLERFIFEIVNRDVEKTEQALIEATGNQNETLINILRDFKNVIKTASISNKRANKQIEDWYLRTDYLMDPYTALVLEQLSQNNKTQYDAEKIIIPVIEHPLLSSQTMAEAIFPKNKIKRKPFYQIMNLVSEESGLTAPISTNSTKATPEIIYAEINDLISKLEEFLLD